ncbi:MAG: Transglycosylase associated protein [Candidatus Udaeobacter sp.]|nr:MAG: Transglycosylase associated protein [Candidatus Udaeobacter sp.]
MSNLCAITDESDPPKRSFCFGKFDIAAIDFQMQELEKNMLHLIWYIFVGFLVGCVAKALMHTHLSIMWTVVLGIVGSIIGGAVTHLFYPPGAGGKFHLGGVIVSIVGAILVLYIWHKFRLQLPRG